MGDVGELAIDPVATAARGDCGVLEGCGGRGGGVDGDAEDGLVMVDLGAYTQRQNGGIAQDDIIYVPS